MSSTKRPAPDSVPESTPPPSIKRQDTGATKQEDNRITPAPKPGSYRLVKGLRSSVTGDSNELWPGLWLDSKLKDFLLEGKKIPKTVKDALEYPGVFKDIKVSEKSKIAPIWLIGNDNTGALWVPTSLLQLMDRKGIEAVIDDPTTSKALRNAYRAVLEGHDLDYWMQHFKRESEEIHDSDAEQFSEGSDNGLDSDDTSDETAALRMLANKRPHGPGSVPVNSRNAATNDKDVLQGDAAVDTPMIDADMLPTLDTRQGRLSQQHHLSTNDNTALFGNETRGSAPTASASASRSLESDPRSTSRSEVFEMASAANKQGDVKVEGEGAKSLAAWTARELAITGAESAITAEIQKRRQVRRVNANRKASKDEIRMSIGRFGDEFIVKRSGIDRSDYLKEKVEHDTDDDEFHISTHKFKRFEADDFDAVAEFLNTNDFEPVIVKDETGTQVLKDFDRTDTALAKRLIMQSVKICGIACQLELPKLSQLAVQKFKLLDPYNADDFVDFLYLMEKQNYCNDAELQNWLMQYSADHFYDLLEGDRRFRSFLENAHQTEQKIFRIKIGLPAEDPALAPKKKVVRKRAPKKEAGEEQSGSTSPQTKKATNATAKKTAPTAVKKEPVEKTSSPIKHSNTKKSSDAATTHETIATKATPAKGRATKAAAVKKPTTTQTDDADDHDDEAMKDQAEPIEAEKKAATKAATTVKGRGAKVTTSKLQTTTTHRNENDEDEAVPAKAKPSAANKIAARKPGPKVPIAKGKNAKVKPGTAAQAARTAEDEGEESSSAEEEEDEIPGRAKQASTSAANNKTRAVAAKSTQLRGKKVAFDQMPNEESSSNSHATKILTVEPPPNITQKIFARKDDGSLIAKPAAKKAKKVQESMQSPKNSIDDLAGTAGKALAGLEAAEAHVPKPKTQGPDEASPMVNSEDEIPRSDEMEQDEPRGNGGANGK